MTERERLTELLKGSLMEHIGKSCNLAENLADHLFANGVMLVDTEAVCLVTNREPIRTAFGMPLDELAELIRAKQEGRIIVPPCKVGDTVWYELYGQIETAVIYSCIGNLTRNGFIITDANAKNSDGLEVVFNGKCIGKTVFLTKEEAEKAFERSK